MQTFVARQMLLPLILVPLTVTVYPVAPAFAQQAPAEDPPATSAVPSQSGQPVIVEPPSPTLPEPPGGKRVFGVLPNYRTAEETAVYTPITARQKMTIASKDSFDYPLVLLAGALAGLGQLTDQNPSFGQGVAGYARRLGTAYGDQSIGNMMTEGFFPILLHEDPRYFRRGHGAKWSRTGYALTRIFVTRTDSGGTRFNYSEWLGNAATAVISNAYYPDGRTATDNAAKLFEMCGTDAVSQVLKEFWPDIRQKLFHHRQVADSGQ